MKKSKLIIVTYPKTAFYESLISGPTILLYDSNHYRENKELEEVLNNLKKVKIVFEDPIEAAKHINRYWDNLSVWWDDEETAEARKIFFTKVALVEKNPFIKWKKFLQKNSEI
jgi:putative transferase (TIGR04331 family)